MVDATQNAHLRCVFADRTLDDRDINPSIRTPSVGDAFQEPAIALRNCLSSSPLKLIDFSIRDLWARIGPPHFVHQGHGYDAENAVSFTAYSSGSVDWRHWPIRASVRRQKPAYSGQRGKTE